MTLQENSSKINISCALMKSLLRQLRHLFVNSKILPFIGALVASYTVVEISVVSILMDYFSDSLVDDLRTAAILTNLLNGVSSLIFIFVSLISEAYTGPFTMITICAAASIEGLMLLWIAESSSSAFSPVYAAMLFLALGRNDHKLSEIFLENQLEEILEAIKKFELKDGRTKKQNEQDLIRTILMNMLLLAPLFVGYVGIFCANYFIESYEELFKSAALLMGGSYLFFLFGSTWYIHELPGESNVGKIFRICKAAFGRRRSDYPTSQNCYYWKGNVRTDLCYEKGKEMRLKPQVPRLFRWLDKAAIDEVSPETQEREGKVCTVKEVREVKSLVPMIYLCFAFFAYSLLMATGNTFFVAQASSLKTTNSNDIARLFLIKGATRRMSKFIFFFVMVGLSCMRPTDFISKRIAVTTSIIRIGFGMVCAVICSFIARKVEFHRLHLPLIKDKDGDLKRAMKTTVLVPQFMLLGLTEGLVEGGFKTLFLAHVAKPLWSFEDSYSELMNGIGKLLLIPIILFSSKSWFKESIDESHLDRFYLMLGILNAAFLLVFAYYSIKYTYKEICPKDEDAHQPHLQDSNQQDEEQDVENDEEQDVENDEEQVKANVDEQDEENDEEQTNVEEQDEENDEEQFEGNGEEQYEGNDDVNIFELIT